MVLPKPRSIVVASGDAATRRLLSSVAEAEGYIAVAVASGADAYGCLAELGSNCALVLLDMSLVDMDAFEFRELQLDAPLAACIPTVILSPAVLTHREHARLQPVAAVVAGTPVYALRRCVAVHTCAPVVGETADVA